MRLRIILKALDQGVNFLILLILMGMEEGKFLGEIIKDSREKIYVTTKLGRRIRGQIIKEDINIFQWKNLLIDL